MQSVTTQDADISIVVPALNEAGNLPSLLQRLHCVLCNYHYEVLVVDDASQDGTPNVCAALERVHPLRLLIRSNPTDGLSGAVLHGLAQARGRFLVVMDADLQHPPEQVPDLLEPLRRGEADFVLGSRYVAGGTTDGKWGVLRQLNSRAATFLARPFAGPTRDPMSGFFAMPREVYQRGSGFNPIGYKIALELMCKCQVRRVCEVPIRFGLRDAGESKLTLRQQVRYLDHLSRLYDYCFPRASTWAKFVIATGIAWFVAFGLYVRLVAHAFSPVLAPTLAFAAAAFTTAAFHHRSLRRHGDSARRGRDWIDFAMVTVGEWSICVLAAKWVSLHVLPMSAVQFFGVTFGLVAMARYGLRTGFVRDLRGMRILAR